MSILSTSFWVTKQDWVAACTTPVILECYKNNREKSSGVVKSSITYQNLHRGSACWSPCGFLEIKLSSAFRKQKAGRLTIFFAGSHFLELSFLIQICETHIRMVIYIMVPSFNKYASVYLVNDRWLEKGISIFFRKVLLSIL